MKIFFLIILPFLMLAPSCASKKKEKVIIHKVHTPKIKRNKKKIEEDSNSSEEKVLPFKHKKNEEHKYWPWQ